FGVRLRARDAGLGADLVIADQKPLLPEIAAGGIDDLRDVEIGRAVAAKDLIVLLPEPALELEADLPHLRVADGTKARLDRRGQVRRNPGKHGNRERAYAVIRR